MRALHRVVILGGGFAGVRVARSLARASARQHLAVTLVNRDGRHVYAPGMYALAGAASDAARHRALDRSMAHPLRRVLAGLPVSFVQGEVTAVDAAQNTVTLADGRQLGYDTLVIAIGSEATYYGIPGLKEHALALKTVEDADRVNRTIFKLMRGRNTPVRITVGGGGPTGVELSAMLAERLAPLQAGVCVTLLEAGPTILNGFSESTQRYVTDELACRDITVRTGTAITSASEHAVMLGDEKLEHDVLVWVGGTQGPPLLSSLPFVTERGRLAADAPLTVVPQEGGVEPHVYVLGDAACFHYKGKPAPWTVTVALEEANHVAKNILRRLRGEKEKPFKLKHQDFVIPLGRTGGIASYKYVTFKGRMAQALSILAEARYLRTIVPWHEVLRLIWKRVRGL